MDKNSFILGGLYVGTSVAVVAYLLSAVRAALAAQGAKKRTYDTFGHAAHPRLTASGVVHNSNLAGVRAAALALLLIVFVALSVGGCFVILQS